VVIPIIFLQIANLRVVGLTPTKPYISCGKLYSLTRFSTKILVIRLENGGWAGGRILNGVKLKLPLNNFSLLWPIDTKLAV